MGKWAAEEYAVIGALVLAPTAHAIMGDKGVRALGNAHVSSFHYELGAAKTNTTPGHLKRAGTIIRQNSNLTSLVHQPHYGSKREG